MRSLSIDAADKCLLSGDVNSVIGSWDLPTAQNIRMGILPGQTAYPTNAVMDEPFTHHSDAAFYALQRSGFLALCDLRTPELVQWHGRLHLQRSNYLKLCERDHCFVTSARGSEIKLWDFRKLSAAEAVNSYVQIFAKHKSQTLPVDFDYLNYEKYIVTGSDDGYAYIYETVSGEVVARVALGRGQVQSVCAVSDAGLSFFASFLESRYLGLIDTEGDSLSHAPKTTDEIKSAFNKHAWDAVVSSHSDRIFAAVRGVTNPPLGYNNWMRVIRESDAPQCKQLAAELAQDYEAEMMKSTPALVQELNVFFSQNADRKTPKQRRTTIKRGKVAPKVRTERCILRDRRVPSSY